jgi:hypothetical protein
MDMIKLTRPRVVIRRSLDGVTVLRHESLAWLSLNPISTRRAFSPNMLRLRAGLFELDLNGLGFVPAVKEQKSVLEMLALQVC